MLQNSTKVYSLKNVFLPGQYDSVGWSVVLNVERSQIQFPIRAHTQVCRFNPWSGFEWETANQFLSLSLSLFSPPPSLSLSLKKCFPLLCPSHLILYLKETSIYLDNLNQLFHNFVTYYFCSGASAHIASKPKF